jgi:hypothetical protein
VILIVPDPILSRPGSVVQDACAADLDLPRVEVLIEDPVVVEQLVDAFAVLEVMPQHDGLTNAEGLQRHPVSSELLDMIVEIPRLKIPAGRIRNIHVKDRDPAKKIGHTGARIHHVVVGLGDDQKIFLEGNILDFRVFHQLVHMRRAGSHDSEHLNSALPDVSMLDRLTDLVACHQSDTLA